MTTIHLIYPHGPGISSPNSIGRHLGRKLAEKYNVFYHDWDEMKAIRSGPDDVLLGHPHPFPGTCFRKSVKNKGWKRIIMMSPYNHGDNMQVAFLNPLIKQCDLYLAITGNYWYFSVNKSLFSHWCEKMIHIDMAIDRNDFPIIKTTFNKPNQRKFLYIGHTDKCKNTKYLTEIARKMPDVQFSRIGKGKPIEGVKSLGYHDFSTKAGKKVVASYDFMITVGYADANPTTILEAMGWGLIPVCTKQSGYSSYQGIINIPLNNSEKAVKILRELSEIPEKRLAKIQKLNWKILDDHFNWDRFARQVIQAIESSNSPEMQAETKMKRWKIELLSMVSPNSPLWPLNILRFIISNRKKKKK